MYNVSNNYKKALQQPVLISKLAGTIGSVSFSDDNILAGSMQVSNQCADGSTVIGSVYIGELKATFLGININKNEWRKQTIRFTESIQLEDGTYEAVPSCTYIIDSAERSASGVTIKAYDYMSKFDRSFNATTLQGNVYELLSAICKKAGVTLAHTEEEVLNWPNTLYIYNLSAENDCSTWRDVLFWLTQLLGRYATINRNDQLELREYTTDVSASVNEDMRLTGGTFSDFVTHYAGISVTDLATQKTIIESTPEDGSVYNAGPNPFLQYISDEQRRVVMRSMLSALKKVSYTPAKLSVRSTFAYDLGDVIEASGGLGESDIICVMQYIWKYHNTTSIQTFGKDPALSDARSKVAKDVSGLLSQVDAKSIQYYIFELDDKVKDTNDEEQLIFFNATTLGDIFANLQTQLNYEATGSGVITYRTYVNDELVHTCHFTPGSGYNINALFMPLQMESNEIVEVSITASTTGDLVLHFYDSISSLSGQGLAATTEWNGKINLSDSVRNLTLQSFGITRVTGESISSHAYDVKRAGASDSLGYLVMPSLGLMEIGEGMSTKPKAILKTWNEIGSEIWNSAYQTYEWGRRN